MWKQMQNFPLCYDFFLASYSESLAFIPSGTLSGALRKNFCSSLFSRDSVVREVSFFTGRRPLEIFKFCKFLVIPLLYE